MRSYCSEDSWFSCGYSSCYFNKSFGLESDREIAAAVSLVDEIQNEFEGSFEKAGDVPTSKRCNCLHQ